MKYLIIFTLFFSYNVMADNLQLATDTLLLADMSQTINISENCGAQTELNPVLGRCPQRNNVIVYFVGYILLTHLIANNLSSDNRKIYLSIISGMEIQAIGNNVNFGVHFSF